MRRKEILQFVIAAIMIQLSGLVEELTWVSLFVSIFMGGVAVLVFGLALGWCHIMFGRYLRDKPDDTYLEDIENQSYVGSLFMIMLIIFFIFLRGCETYY